MAGENNISTSMGTRINVCAKRLKLSWFHVKGLRMYSLISGSHLTALEFVII